MGDVGTNHDFLESLALRAATLDELISDDFCSVKGQKADSDKAARRLAAWCRSSTSGDWELFARRLAKDGLTFEKVLSRLASVQRNPAAPIPRWLEDSHWVCAALLATGDVGLEHRADPAVGPMPFEHLLIPLVHTAVRRLRASAPETSSNLLTPEAWNQLANSLLALLAELCAPAYFEGFRSWSATSSQAHGCAETRESAETDQYFAFIDHMRANGLKRLLDDKPVLLRLVASITRQWIDSTCEFLARLAEDQVAVRRQLVASDHVCRIARIEAGLSDRHNRGRSVMIVAFEDGARAVYKPKDMRLDAFWYELIGLLNASSPPTVLRAARILVRNGYGWSEFIEHTACVDRQGLEDYYFRAGALVILFHLLSATDMHEENIVAAGDQPVAIDLEMILQGSKLRDEADTPGMDALHLAIERIADSVMMTGILPAYGRTPENKVYRWGGLNEPPPDGVETFWTDVNTSQMRPARRKRTNGHQTNLPRLDDSPGLLSEHLPSLLSGFDSYGAFLCDRGQDLFDHALLGSLAGLPVRRVRRPTRFYGLLLGRLKDHRNMGDGAEWSANLDFLVRLSDTENPKDETWQLLRAERDALADLNVPFFVARSDGVEVTDLNGIGARSLRASGLSRAKRRIASLDAAELRWQREVILAGSGSLAKASEARTDLSRERVTSATRPAKSSTNARFMESAREVAGHLTQLALRSGTSAAWIGLDWLGDSEFCQLSPFGFDLYGGAPGVSVFLAAYARTAGDPAAEELSRAGVAPLRGKLRGEGSARFARSLGLGGATGMGSVVYSLTTLSDLLDDASLLDDARLASDLFTDELIGADRSFDVIGGAAGGILGLLKLYRRTGDRGVLERAICCGKHLLRHRSRRAHDRGMWIGQGMGQIPLVGMSHGAAGFAYAFTSLSTATGREKFADAARECLEFENSFASTESDEWLDPRCAGKAPPPLRPCQWCHGAGGIGHARLGMSRASKVDHRLRGDIERAVRCVEKAWPYSGDSLCCGNLGNIEFLCEAGDLLGRQDLKDLAAHRLSSVVTEAEESGDYRWLVGQKRFNLGLFRGMAGVGYTLLRRVNPKLPNVLVWE